MRVTEKGWAAEPSAMTRTERTYYLVFGLYNVSWSSVGPVYALFLLDRGLDLFEINLVLATYLTTSFLFEVPTGAVADHFGRKISFLLSCLVRMSAYFLYAFSESLPEFLLAEFIDAVGTTLASGALDAWAVDGMRAEGQRTATDRFFARAGILSRVLMVLGGVAGGYLAERSLVLPWFAGSGFFALTGLTALVLMREGRKAVISRRRRGRSLWGQAHLGLRHVHATSFLQVACLLTAATALATMPVHMLWQPRMQGLAGGELSVMGWIWALINAFALLGNALVPYFAARAARPIVLSAAALWRAATVAVAALATTMFPALGGLLLQEVAFGVSEPLLLAWVNEHVEEGQRATVLSVRAMYFTLGGAAGLVSLGLLARSAGIPAAWTVAAAVLLLTAPGLLWLGRAAPGRQAPRYHRSP
jgi:MFS family permease